MTNPTFLETILPWLNSGVDREITISSMEFPDAYRLNLKAGPVTTHFTLDRRMVDEYLAGPDSMFIEQVSFADPSILEQ